MHWIEWLKLLDPTGYTNEEHEFLSINNHSKHYCVWQPELKQNQICILTPLYTQFCGQIIFCMVYFNVMWRWNIGLYVHVTQMYVSHASL